MTMRDACGSWWTKETHRVYPSIVCGGELIAPVHSFFVLPVTSTHRTDAREEAGRVSQCPLRISGQEYLAFLFGWDEQDFVDVDMQRLSHCIDNSIRDILALQRINILPPT